MRPIDNYILSLERKKTRTLPIYASCISEFLCHYYGITNKEFVENPEKHCEVTIQAIQEFGFSCIVPVSYILFGCGPEMGVTWKYAGGNLPGAVKGIINGESDIDSLKVPEQPEGFFKNYLKILNLMSKEIGHEIYILGLVQGPHTCAVFLRGLEDALVDPFLELGLYKKYMRYCSSLSMFLGRNIGALKLPGKALLEIFLTPETIGAKYYNDYIRKYHKDVITQLDGEGIRLSNTYATFVDQDQINENFTKGQLLYHYFFGTKESLEVIELASSLDIPGFPPLITISGTMMTDWNKASIAKFISSAADLFVQKKGLYPTIKLVSVPPRTKIEAVALAEKLKMISDLSRGY